MGEGEAAIVAAGPALGRAGRLVEALRGGSVAWGVAEDAARAGPGEVVLVAPGGGGEAREVDLVGLLRRPVADAGLVASLDAAPWGELADPGVPDLVRDDHAAWLAAVWARARGARVRGSGAGGSSELTGPGRAWLAAEALRWIGPGVLSRETLEAGVRA